MLLKKIKGNTFYIDMGKTNIPFYKIDNKKIIMLDSGFNKIDREKIQNVLDSNDLQPVGIICSHAHADHAGNNMYLKKKYDCIIAMSECEAFICNSESNLKFYYNNQYNTYTTYDIRDHLEYMVCETDIIIGEEQHCVELCGIKFGIIHTAGHSPGHICIVTPDNVAYLGDALISHEVIKNAKMPYTYNLSEDLKSKASLYNLKCEKYIVAHKGIYQDITKLIEDNINLYRNIAARLYNIIEGTMTMEHIIKNAIESFNICVNNTLKYIMVDKVLRLYIEYFCEIRMVKMEIKDGFLKYSKVP